VNNCIKIERITFEDVDALLWDSFLVGSAIPSFQYRYNWIYNWIHHINSESYLILQAKNDNEVVGYIPLMYQDSRRRGILPYRRIKFLASDKSDFTVLPIRNEFSSMVLKAGINWLFSKQFWWNIMILDDIEESSCLVQTLKEILSDNNITYETVTGKYYFINFKEDWSQVENNFNTSMLKKLKSIDNKLRNHTTFEILINPPWSVEEIVNRMVAAHNKRQTELLRDPIYSKSNEYLFLKKNIEINSKAGSFFSAWLFIEHELACFKSGFIFDNIYYAWITAFNSDFKQFAPGRYLSLHLMKYLYDKGIDKYNFMRGEGAGKDKFTNSYTINYRFRIINDKTIYGLLCHRLDRLLH
jgi:CelD/BcsL family acetyltransferase involved in cellulose biosynthesis